ncbi:hypothetical protein OG203_16845 [Nocardia sp. NBC_01499]|uniref:hypothetical protein n=1 Tax=Nocardia sp. NBC_01499 TaxID=2903597 RepID=UPI00386EF2C2
MRLIGRTGWSATAAAVLLAAACATDSHPDRALTTSTTTPRRSTVPAADYTFPTEWAGNYTFQWSAADGIDLAAPNAAVVRAFAESKRLAMSVGNTLSYPGYSAAVSAVDWLNTPDGGAYPVGAEHGDWQLRWSGTFLARIMRIQLQPKGFAAAYCLDYTNVADSIDGGSTYRWNRPGQRGEPRRGWLIGFTAQDLADNIPDQPVTTSLTPGPPDRAPHYNVFEGLRVTRAWGPTPHDVDSATLVEACTTWTRNNPQTNPVGIDSVHRRIPADPPPDPTPPYPGWPGRHG